MTRIAVAGAGIGGLAAALTMAAGGVHVAILERRSAPAEFGAGLQLSPNATRILANFGLLEAVRADALEPQSVVIRRGSDGSELARLPLGPHARARYGAPFLLVLRPALQRALLELIDGEPRIQIRYGTRVDGVAEGAGATVVINTSAGPVEADGFVDARGIGAARARPARRVAWRALVDAGRLPPGAREPITCLWLGRRTHLVHYPLPDRERVNVVAVTEDTEPRADRDVDLWSQAGDPQVLRHAFSGWDREPLSYLDPDAEWRRWPLFDAAPRHTWTTGATTLLGDAAHPMLPFLAQGASQAIEDAGALATSLARMSAVPAAFAVYEARRLPRASRVQNASRRQGDIYHLPRPASDARDLTMRLLGGPRALTRMDWLYEGA